MQKDSRNILPVWALSALCLGLSIQSQAQIRIGGSVQTPQGKPIAYATVVIAADSAASKHIAYAVTDRQGQFVIPISGDQPGRAWLIAQYIGHTAERRRIGLRQDAMNLKIVLAEKQEQIGEVYVKGDAPDILTRGHDTIVYNTASYRLGNEQNIGDVLNRMPGIKVDPQGNLSYQGQTIEKVLINGRDVIEANGLAIKTLPPHFAHTAELLKDYTDDDIAHKFRKRKRLAINLKSSQKLSLNGTIEAGGGINSKFLGRASLISLLPEVSVTTLGNSNNTGESLYSLDDHLKRSIDHEFSKSNEVEISSMDAHLLYPPDYEYKRIAGLGNLNVVWNPTKRYKLTANTLYSQNLSEGGETHDHQILSDLGTIESHEESLYENRSSIFSQHIRQKWTRSKRFTLEAKTSVNYSQFRDVDSYSNGTASGQTLTQEQARMRTIQLIQSGKGNWLVGRGWIFLRMLMDYEAQDGTNSIRTNERILPFVHRELGGAYSHMLPLGERQRSMGGKGIAGFVYPLLWDIHAQTELRYAWKHQQLENQISKRHTHEQGTLHHYHATIGLAKSKRLLQFDVGTGFSLYSLGLQHSRSKQAHRLIALEPYAKLKLQFGAQHNLRLGAERSVQLASLTHLSKREHVSRYDQMMLASRLSNPFGWRMQGDLLYTLYSLRHRFSLFVNMLYRNERHLPLLASDSQGTLILQRYEDGGWSRSLNGNIDLEKGLPNLPIDGILEAAYGLQRNNLLRGDREDEIESVNYSGEFGLKSRFRNSYVNGEIRAGYSKESYRFRLLTGRGSSREISYQATVHCKVGRKLNLSLSGYFRDYKDNEEYAQQYADFAVAARYSLGAFTLRLTGSNLLHLRSNLWIEQRVSTIVQSTRRYQRMPGYLVLSLAWKF